MEILDLPPPLQRVILEPDKCITVELMVGGAGVGVWVGWVGWVAG